MSLYILCAVYLGFAIMGLIFIRMGGGVDITAVNSIFNVKLSVYTLIGLTFYVISFVLYIAIVPRISFTRILPILTGVLYMLTVFSGIALFREKVTAQHLVGLALVLVGVIVLGFASTE